MLKHLPAKSLDTIKETLLYDETKVTLLGGRDRRSSTSNTPGDRTDVNLASRITEFHALLSQRLYYRIPLKYFLHLDLVNFSEKTDTKFIFTLKSNTNKLFETNAKVDNIPETPDALIIYHDTPYISYQYISMGENFQVYFNAILLSKKALLIGVQFSRYQQTLKMNVRTQSINVNFQGVNRQFRWLEILLVYDKRDQHQTIFDSYGAEVATTQVQSLTLENTS